MPFFLKYFWCFASPFVAFAAFGNLATGVLAYAWAVLIRMSFWILEEEWSVQSPRSVFYSLLIAEVAVVSYSFLRYGTLTFSYLPYVLVSLLFLWLTLYRKSGDGRRDRDLLWQHFKLWEVRLAFQSFVGEET